MMLFKGLTVFISDNISVLEVFGRFPSGFKAYLARFSLLVLRAIESGETGRAVAYISRKR